ncbi:hypothetical protein EXIGLDRAFT_833860 [Exidia glandulosa HHB12029]|uniref:Zn(2)-C6 fungal-type domain-containing protein n=1 Tax=Exidia glandulosa HHB12029 TaxID=1314781 RepID=A0A165KAV6_EXIGL|nr:hypothetical protein EXIGLDRAFT_833860 [Exidia glandulosa HHB12029]
MHPSLVLEEGKSSNRRRSGGNNGQGDNSGARHKHHIVTACNNCRRMKIRCDGERPCGRCKLHNAKCLWTMQIDRRRNPNKDEIEALNARVKYIEDENEELKGENDLLRQKLQEFGYTHPPRARRSPAPYAPFASTSAPASSTFDFSLPNSPLLAPHSTPPAIHSRIGSSRSDGDGSFHGIPDYYDSHSFTASNQPSSSRSLGSPDDDRSSQQIGHAAELLSAEPLPITVTPGFVPPQYAFSPAAAYTGDRVEAMTPANNTPHSGNTPARRGQYGSFAASPAPMHAAPSSAHGLYHLGAQQQPYMDEADDSALGPDAFPASSAHAHARHDTA